MTHTFQTEASERGLLRLVVKNSALALVVRIASMAVAVVTTPILIRELGTQGFGAYSAVTALSAFLVFADQGLAVGVRTRLAEENGAANHAAAREVIGSGLAMMLLIAAGLVLAALLSGLLVPWGSVLGKVGDQTPDAARLVPIFLAVVSAGLIAVVAPRALEGLNKTPFVTASALVTSAYMLVGIVFLAYTDAGLSGFVLFAALSPLPALLTCWLVLLGLDASAMRPALSDISMKTMGSIWLGSAPTLIISLALSFAYSLDPLVIAHYLGSRATAEYAVIAKLSQIGLLVVTAASPILWTHFASRRARLPRAEGDLWRLTACFGFAGVAIGGGLVALGPLTVSLWTQGQIGAPRSVLLAFAVWGTILAAHLPVASALTSDSDLWFQARTTSLMALANVVVSIWLINVVGISGPVWASAACLLTLHAAPLWNRYRHSVHGSGNES